MREKIYKVLNKIYGVLLSISLFAGLLPIFPFIIAIILGGSTAESICLFLYNEYYPWVIAAASFSVIIGLIAMYIGKLQGFTIKKKNKETETKDNSSNLEEIDMNEKEEEQLNTNLSENSGENN